MSTATITECPRPDKRKLTEAEAKAHVGYARHNLNPDIRAYQCACGAWHVGKSKVEFNKRLKRVVSSGSHKYRVEQSRNGRRGRR